jgi:hypothetical protein
MRPAHWRYEPLAAGQFPVGASPFRARGLAYVNALRYVDTRTPGARRAFLDAIGAGDPLVPFFEQLFLVTGEYDVSPLLRLFVVAAQLEAVPVAEFIQQRARWSGGSDTKGVWKPSLHGATPGEVASRLNFAFERYFPPCGAEVIAAGEERFDGELRRLPSCMNGLYAQSTVGFYLGALESAGARDVHVHFEPPQSDGHLRGIPLERVRFFVQWERVARESG